MSEKTKVILIFTFLILVVPFAMFKMNGCKKQVSYNFYYENNVEQTIREMVKPEYLINP